MTNQREDLRSIEAPSPEAIPQGIPSPGPTASEDSADGVGVGPSAELATGTRASPCRPPRAAVSGSKPKDPSIETLRGLAILSVVIGHVIGSSHSSGLQVGPVSIYRYLYDTTTPLRMPIFFVISGFLYAHRPLEPGKYAEFAKGKMRLLLIPFLSVATLQFLAKATIPGVNRSTSIGEIWRVYAFGFDQFWFSMVTMWIFLLIIVLERLGPPAGRHRWLVPLLLSIGFALVSPKTPLFALNEFCTDLPFFFLGCVLHRPPARLRGPLALSAAFGVFLACLTAQQLAYFDRITLVVWQILTVELFMGLSFTFLLFQFRRSSPLLAVLGGFSYPIYLFHVFGCAGVRLLAGRLGIHASPILLILGTAGGLLLPIAIDLLFRRHVVLRRIFLGGR